VTKPKLTPKIRALIRRTLDRIDRRPSTLDMGPWYGAKLNKHGNECGMTMCFGGHMVAEMGAVFNSRGRSKTKPPSGVVALKSGLDSSYVVVFGDTVRSVLGMRDVAHIVSSEYWPSPFSADYAAAKTHKTRAKVLRGRIEHWMQTGE
jgi:hypothetical protein